MGFRYVAYGLDLHSTFALPGMAAAEGADMPFLELRSTTPEELGHVCSEMDLRPAWRGRLGDGNAFIVEEGNRGGVLFTYGDRARFYLDATGESLACAPACMEAAWLKALITKVLPSVSVMRGYEALHASAVLSPQGAVAILAPSGVGKTTLAAELLRRDWPLLTDDVLVLGSGPAGVLAYPGSPHMNVEIAVDASGLVWDMGEDLVDKHCVAVDPFANVPQPLRMVCLLARAQGLSVDARILPSQPLALLPYMLGLRGDAARERRRFSLYADIAASATLVGLTSDLSDRRTELCDLIEGALGDCRRAVAAGVSV